jgi:NADPH2:quinone reductase
MRAIFIKEYGPIGSHSVIDLPDPTPGPGEVLVENRAIGINFPDALMLQGKYQKRPTPPFVPGRDFAGVVLTVGEGVTRCKPGDHVAAQVFKGAFAELVAAPEKRCFVMPDSIDFSSAAAMLTVFNTAYVACILRGKVKSGEMVLVTGAAGGLGLACVQFLKAHGATVIAVVSTPEKAELTKTNGADHIIYNNVADIKAAFKRRVTEITGTEKGCEMAIDTIGGDVFEACMRILKFEGRVIVAGFSSGEIPVVKTHYLLYNNLSVVGAPVDIHFEHRYEQMEKGVEMWFQLYKQGKIRPNIMASYPLEEFKKAFDLILERKVRGKVILNPQNKV